MTEVHERPTYTPAISQAEKNDNMHVMYYYHYYYYYMLKVFVYSRRLFKKVVESIPDCA